VNRTDDNFSHVDLPSEKLLRGGERHIGPKPNFGQDAFNGGGGAEGAHTDDFALGANVAIPAQVAGI